MWISQRIRDPGSISLPASFGKIWPGLADRPLHEESRRCLHVVRAVREALDAVRFLLLERREHVMHRAASDRDEGLISIARTHRGSVSPVSLTGRNHLSWVWAASVYGSDLITRSGAPSSFANCHPSGSGTSPAAACPSDRPSGAAGVDPADERRDLRVAEAPVVLELLNADGAIDVPWRHQAAATPSS
jgi:hypothetical protein